ncbi:hypothetical protein FSP39_019381 [Pinctada imbricata]|uniref:G-protein coupled receptors family 1 profile domain-containing protein n=1 Tax=Pinctada imbricata TaxID=66713 RepID=A0AA89BRJ0_PINIB|nr:hypothetical protein FSP39_019381 [Pinctada imbricata]
MEFTENITVHENGNHDWQRISELEYLKFVDEDIPVTVFLSLLSIIGSIGNAHAFLVYYLRYKPSNHRTFVVSLAAIDLIASAISIPFEIYDIRYSYTFTSSLACKSFRTMNHVVIVASGLLLGVIAVERFRKACQPLETQLGPKGAICACVFSVVGSAIFSIPAFILYDSTQEDLNITVSVFGNTTTFEDKFSVLHVFDCQIATKYSKSIFNKGYNGMFLLLSTSVFILCIVMYSFVGKALYKQTKFRMRAQSLKRRPSNSSLTSTTITKLDKSTGYIQEEESSSTGDRKRSILRKSSSASLNAISPRNHRRMDRTRRITLMFLVATAVSYIGFVPNLVILLIKSLNRKQYTKISNTLGGGTDILLRLYFLNNVTNPLVYCFLDEKFRTELMMLYRKLAFWNKTHKRVY